LGGILTIALGIILIIHSLGIWDFNLFFKGWWTLFIIIPALFDLINKEYISGSITLGVGILLLLAAQKVIAWSMIWKIILPVALIIIGIGLIWRAFKTKKIDKDNAKRYLAIFSGVDERINNLTSDFEVITVFGGIELDLRECKLNNDVIIDCTSIFGGIELYLPEHANLVLNGVPIFGGVDNHYPKDNTAKHTIYLNYTAIFGGIDIF